MAASHFSGPVYSAAGFIGQLTGPLTNVTGATATVTALGSAGGTVIIDRAGGTTITLPAATGTGNTYTFVVKTTITTPSAIIKVANATDVMTGRCFTISDGAAAVLGYATAASSDTVTLNGTTTGGYLGDHVILTDVASGLWSVLVLSASTGNEATPFSATV